MTLALKPREGAETPAGFRVAAGQPGLVDEGPGRWAP
jgi:hypothetical protein